MQLNIYPLYVRVLYTYTIYTYIVCVCLCVWVLCATDSDFFVKKG